jgi:alcohol dehydrogenase class IV
VSLFRFEVPARVFFGPDARLAVLSTLREAGFGRVGVVLDGALAAQPVFADLLERRLPEHGLEVVRTLHARCDGEPDYDYLDACTASFRHTQLDAVFGLGGGSAMDLAKGIGVLLTNPGPGVRYRGMDLVQQPGVPVVLFPTTGGTGSEVTGTAAFTDLGAQRKLGINGRFVAAWAGVLDPVLSLGCPRLPTMAAGMDALVHSVESFTAVTSSPLARDTARTAFARLFNHLARVVEQPDDVGARGEMLLGAWLAGVALWNACGGGPASAISYPLGVRHRVPHGFAGGLLLPGVVRHNVEHGYAGYAGLAETIPGVRSSHAFADAVDALWAHIEAPRLTDFGIDDADVPALVEETLATRAANVSHNPIPFARADVEALLAACVGGRTDRRTAAAGRRR